jgi:hypothetical protein
MTNAKISAAVRNGVSALSLVTVGIFAAQPANAAVVSVCSGVRLPPSVVTGILSPVLTGIVSPIENVVNPIIGVVGIIPVVGQILPPPSTST